MGSTVVPNNKGQKWAGCAIERSEGLLYPQMTMEKVSSHNRNKRSGRRYTLNLPLVVRWTTGDKRMEAPGRTRDLNSRGIYFHLPAKLAKQSAIEIVLTLPSELSPGGPVKVRCHGHVVRVEPEGEGVGVAVAIDRYEFLRRATGVASAAKAACPAA